MKYRPLPRLGREVSEVGLGTWQLGSEWGTVSDEQAREILHTALDAGITFLDTADVYGDGRSERVIGSVLAEREDRDRLVVATKMGRRADPHVPEAYRPDALRAWAQRSLENLRTDRLDLVQLHCPPPEVLDDDRVFDALAGLVDEGLLGAYGVSVETCDEAMTAIARPDVASVQIILNAFRRKPLEQVLPAAEAAGVAIIARVPLASGLLSGRYDRSTTFAADDHRTFNRHGEAFDVGETFSGVPYELGVEVAQEFAALAGPDRSPAQLALRWVLDQPAVTTVIPGARNVAQVDSNVGASELDPIDTATAARIEQLYDQHLRELVHHRW